MVSVQAYVLVQTAVSRAADVAAAIRRTEGVLVVHDVTGPYDVIVQVEAPTMDDLGALVVSKIQAVDGIVRTLTCPVVNL